MCDFMNALSEMAKQNCEIMYSRVGGVGVQGGL